MKWHVHACVHFVLFDNDKFVAYTMLLLIPYRVNLKWNNFKTGTVSKAEYFIELKLNT